MNALARLLTHQPGVDLADRVKWVESVIAEIAESDLHDDVKQPILLDLKASLGAIVAWGRGPRTDESLQQLQGLIAALTTRATTTTLRALADDWRAIAEVGDEVQGAHEIVAALEAAADALARGEPISATTQAQIAQIRARAAKQRQ